MAYGSETGARDKGEAMSALGYDGLRYEELPERDKKKVDELVEAGSILNGGTWKLQEIESALD